jgi:hypothetical protein
MGMQLSCGVYPEKVEERGYGKIRKFLGKPPHRVGVMTASIFSIANRIDATLDNQSMSQLCCSGKGKISAAFVFSLNLLSKLFCVSCESGDHVLHQQQWDQRYCLVAGQWTLDYLIQPPVIMIFEVYVYGKHRKLFAVVYVI